MASSNNQHRQSNNNRVAGPNSSSVFPATTTTSNRNRNRNRNRNNSANATGQSNSSNNNYRENNNQNNDVGTTTSISSSVVAAIRPASGGVSIDTPLPGSTTAATTIRNNKSKSSSSKTEKSNSNDTNASTVAGTDSCNHNTTNQTSTSTPTSSSASSTRRELTVEEMNMKRCNKIIECQKQIAYWKKQLNHYRSEHSKMQLLATLQCPTRNVDTWNTLTKKEKWKKQYVLLLLQCAKSKFQYNPAKYDPKVLSLSNRCHTLQQQQAHLPSCDSEQQKVVTMLHEMQSNDKNKYLLPVSLQEHAWEKCVPIKLQQDREIFLARIATWHFRSYHNNNNTQQYQCLPGQKSTASSSSTTLLNIPERFWNEKEAMKQVIFYYPEVLMHHNNPLFPAHYWKDPEIFQQFILSPNIHYGKVSVREVLEKFDVDTIRKDPDWMVLTLQQSCFCFDQIHPSLRDDKQFVLNAFRACGEYIPTDTLSLCSSRLRSDMDVVLEAVRRNGLCIKYAEQGLPAHYRVMLEAAKNDPTSFIAAYHGKAKVELRHDKSFWINTMFHKLTSTDHYHSLNPLIKIVAVHNKDAGRVTSRESAARANHNKKKSIITCEHDNDDNNHDGQACQLSKLWSLVGWSLKDDVDIVVAAIQAGCININNLSDRMKKNSNFWFSLIRKEPEMWFKLPDPFKNDKYFVVHALQRFPNDTMIKTVFHRFPQLRYSRDVWLKAVQSAIPSTADTSSSSSSPSGDSNGSSLWGTANSNVVFGTLSSRWTESSLLDILNMAPPSILQDKEIMVIACSVDYNVYEMINFPLSDDRDILEAMLKCSPEALHLIESNLQLRYPDLVVSAIHALPPDEMWDIFDSIDEELWAENRDVALAWVSKGGDYLHDEFPTDYEDDPDIFLYIAKHNPHDFWCASETLCSNKEFMLQVVEINGQLLCEAWSNLSRDFDLAVVAFASAPDLCNRYDINDHEDFLFITTLARDVRQQIQQHHNFQKLILCGMTASNPGDNCRLPLLDQGKETSSAYKKLLAEYIGIPTGKYLRQLRQASANLATWGF